MSISLFDATVTNYLQVLNATAGVLEKGKSFCEDNGIDLSEVVETRLIEDMNLFRFQVISVVHHSLGALKGLDIGEFAPPAGYGDPDYAGLQGLVNQAISQVGSFDAEVVNGWAGKTLTFKLGSNEIPFTAENYVLSFSLPNFYFHATTTYDILRMKGVSLGKRDYIGAMRMGV
ncbi:MAG: DUF1993 domain-containing protein [Proteobacteria bacterium]|nr:DUF1993 domain-containing protein [Pseudomonadota bacterium]